MSCHENKIRGKLAPQRFRYQKLASFRKKTENYDAFSKLAVSDSVSLVAILHQNCAFQRSKNAALVVNSLIQLHVIETFSDNSSDMCHGE